MTRIVLLFVVAFFAFCQANDELKNHALECVAKVGITYEFVDNSEKGGVFPDKDDFKCYHECLFEKAGFLNEAKELNIDVVREKLKDNDDKTKEQEAITECANIHGSDACDTSYLASKCFFTQLHKLSSA